MLNHFINNQNIMKHYQLILAAAIVAIAGCNKVNIETVDETESNEIGFAAVTRKATKANNAIITGTDYPLDNSFGIWGFNSPAGDWSEFASTKTSNFMTGLEIKQTTGRDSNRSVAWRNADNYYYWPYTGAIAFIACHPFGVTPTVNYDGATLTDYAISSTNKTVDLMFATATGSRALNAINPVSMAFKHALSQIYFTIKTDADYTADHVTFAVNSVTIKGIDLSGTVSYDKNNITWSSNDTQSDNWTYFSGSAVAATSAGVNLGSAVVMIPQTANTKNPSAEPADNSETTLAINYTMTQNTTETTGDIEISAPQIWEVGKKYQYILNFQLSEILFNPSVNDWAQLTVITKNITE